MSTPFPMEDADQFHGATWDPWKGPQSPHWYAGLEFNEDTHYAGAGYRIWQGMEAGAGKAEAMLGGLVNLAGRAYNSGYLGKPAVVGSEIAPIGERVMSQGRELAKRTTPDPATMGTAANVLHGVSSGATEFGAGLLAGGPLGGAAMVGGSEGLSKFQEQREQGVDTGTASIEAGLTGGVSAAAAFIPGGFGPSLLTRLATGAGAQASLGVANRYADHLILEHAGYHDMADQVRPWDGAQIAVDAAVGATFGGLHHLASPDHADAAMTVNLGNRDRRSAPGVAVNPRSANAHQAALERATGDLLAGRSVDVADSGLDDAAFLERPAADTSKPRDILADTLRDTGFLEEEQTLADLERQLAGRRGEELPEVPKIPKRNTKTPDPREDSMLQYLAKHDRGLSTAEAEAQGLDKADMAGATVGIKRAFRKEGMSFDEAAETLSEAGYPVKDERGNYSPNVLLERLTDELAGKPVHSVANTRAALELDADHAHEMRTRAELEKAAPEFANEPKENQDMTLLATRAREYDPDATEKALDTQADDRVVRERLERIVADGRAKGTIPERPGSGEALPEAAGRPPETAESLADHALAESPDLELPGRDGTGTPAADILSRTDESVTQGVADIGKGIPAAINCFSRRGS